MVQWRLPPPEACEDPDEAEEPRTDPMEPEPWLPPLQTADPPDEPEVRAGAGAAKEPRDGVERRVAAGWPVRAVETAGAPATGTFPEGVAFGSIFAVPSRFTTAELFEFTKRCSAGL